MLYIKGVIRVIFNIFKLSLIKLYKGKSLTFKPIQFLSLDTVIDIRGNSSKLKLGSKISARPRVSFAIRNGYLNIGDNVFFNSGCTITCHEDIQIGNDCLFGPNVLFFDHEHIYGGDKIINKEGFIKGKIKLGKNVFIGANCVILKGTTIGDNCVIAAGTVVKGDIPSNSLVYQERNIVIKSTIIDKDGTVENNLICKEQKI